MSHHNKQGLPYCQNCHYPIAELDKFCPNCGQKNSDGHVSLHDLWHELSHYFTHVDNKIFVTIKDLLIPGKLTDEFFKGHRKRYIHPINLFFVVGVIMPFIMGQMWHDAAKEGNLTSGFIKEKELYRNDLLFEMDSTVKHDTSRFSGQTRAILDTFLLKNYQRSNTGWAKVDTTERGYTVQYYLTLDKLNDARKAITLLHDTLYIDKNFIDKPLMRQRLVEYDNYLLRLTYDSLTILTKYAQLKEKSPAEAREKLKMGVWGYNFGKSLASKGKKPKPFDLDSVMRYPANYDPIKARLDSIHRIIKRDSANIGFIAGQELKIDELDLYSMDNDEIVDKYHVSSWRGKMAIKQTKKFGQNGMEAIMKGFADKSIWLTIFSMIPSAWFMLLLYKSQKRLYVEHLVFLIHYSCLTFITSVFMLIHSNWAMYFSMFLGFVVLIIGIKRFYKQSWGKSVLKGTIFYVFYTIVASVLSVIGLLLSILFT